MPAKMCPRYVRQLIQDGRGFVSLLDNPDRKGRGMKRIKVWEVEKRVDILGSDVVTVAVWNGMPHLFGSKVLHRFEIDFGL